MAEKMTTEKAAAFLAGGFHCSQCVMEHTAAPLGMDRELALRMTSGLGGGCMQGDICGAVSAGILSIGIAYGFDRAGAKEENALVLGKVKEFEARFAEKYGSLTCTGLLGGNITNPEDAKRIVAEGRNKACPGYCAGACDILDDMLGDKMK